MRRSMFALVASYLVVSVAPVGATQGSAQVVVDTPRDDGHETDRPDARPTTPELNP